MEDKQAWKASPSRVRAWSLTSTVAMQKLRYDLPD
jgi:hypothetical protein